MVTRKAFASRLLVFVDIRLSMPFSIAHSQAKEMFAFLAKSICRNPLFRLITFILFMLTPQNARLTHHHYQKPKNEGMA